MAQSRHAQCADECPLLGAKRTLQGSSKMSALPSKADMPAQLAPVLPMLRFFEPPLRLTLRLILWADSFGLATQMASFKCAGPSVNEAWIVSPSMLVPNSD